ncbi:hypothetical protein JK358_36140 [Nocardia sp. 2]|uniref:Uncharacterized protein n=1 Tax=Nocardia acididurans TaxID=2802282 RepID=A0ABS1MGY4_9NOCA|nr:DUF6374 family protein [Nocardia acididurans]MBL1079844.1 hypothetical protein [Nocardia acididurans]
MPELGRLEWARMNLDQVRRQLLDAAAWGKWLTPEQLEHAARKIAEGMRIYAEETAGRVAGQGDPAGAEPTATER